MKKIMFLIVASLSLVGCANLNSIYRTFDISKGESPMVDIRQRAVLVSSNKTTTVCAEPSPDAMASLAYELAAKGGIPEKASGELAFAMHDSAAFTGIRTQSIQLLRDFGYRLCESHLSGAITSAQYDLLMRRFQKNTVALLAIEQLTGTVKSPPVVLTSSGKAEATKSLAEQRAEREKLGDRISDLEKQTGVITKKRDDTKAADAKADTTELDGQISDLEGKITRLKSDRDVIDKAITETKGILAEGKTEVTIKSDTGTSQRSDEHLQKIAGVVGEIVNNIVLSDDEDQLCMTTLQMPKLSHNQQEFANYCIEMFKSRASAKELYIQKLETTMKDAQTKASTATTPSEKEKAEKEIEKVLKELKKESEGKKTYTLTSDM